MCSQPNTYRIDDLDQFYPSQIRSICEVGCDTFVTLTNGSTIQLGVDLCDGCDEEVVPGMACACEMVH